MTIFKGTKYITDPDSIPVTATGGTVARSLGSWTNDFSATFDALRPHPVNGRDPSLSYLIDADWLYVGQRVKTLGYYFPGDGGGNDYEINQQVVGEHDGGSVINIQGINVQAKGLFPDGIVHTKQYGAVGNGVSDDTPMIQAALSSQFKLVRISSGTHVISDSAQDGSPVLSSTEDDRTIYGPGVFTANSRVFKLIEISGDRNVVSINIDGANNISDGILVTGQKPFIFKNVIRNLDGMNDYSAIAIYLKFNSIDNSGIIAENSISNLSASGDSTGGNGIGMTRGVLISATANMTQESLVVNNTMHDIGGEEGDAVTIISNDGSNILDLPCLVTSNVIGFFTRRGLKVQANKVRFVTNSLSNNWSTDPGNLVRAIDIVQGSENYILSNTLTKCLYSGQIGAFMDSSTPSNNIYIEGNIISGVGAETTPALIAFSPHGSNHSVSNNTLSCPDFSGTALLFSNTANSDVHDNRINVSQSAVRFSMINNPGLSFRGQGASRNSYSVGVPNTSTADDSLVVNVGDGNNRSFTLYNPDTVLSDGELIAQIRFWQNDGGTDTVTSSIQAIAQGSLGSTRLSLGGGTTSGGVATALDLLPSKDVHLPTNSYNENRLRLGDHFLWVDASGNLRIKNSSPGSDTDGAIVGTQTP